MHITAAAAAKSLQLCLTLWDPVDGSPPGSAVPEILQARTLEWVAIAFSHFTAEWNINIYPTMSDSLWPHGLYSPGNSIGQNTGVGRLLLLQGIFPTQGSNPGFLHCRQILHQLSHKGSPYIQPLLPKLVIFVIWLKMLNERFNVSQPSTLVS